MGCCKNSAQREIHSNTSLPQKKKKEKYQINNLTHHLNELEKEEKQNLKSAEGRKS